MKTYLVTVEYQTTYGHERLAERLIDAQSAAEARWFLMERVRRWKRALKVFGGWADEAGPHDHDYHRRLRRA